MQLSKVSAAVFAVLLFFTFAAIEFGTVNEERSVTQTDMALSVLILVVVPSLAILTGLWYFDR